MSHESPSLFASSTSVPELRVCAECGQTAAADETIVINGFVVCANCKPMVLAKLQTGYIIGGAGVWRAKKTVVMGLNARLPDRCVKCNAPTDRRLLRRLYWHPPGWYALILLNLIIYAIVAAAVRKRKDVEVGFCDAHRRSRAISIGIGWTLFFGSIAAFVVGSNDLQHGWWIGTACLMLFAGIICGLIGSRVVTAQRIDERWVRFSGAGRAFLADLPAFPEGMPK